MAIQGAFKPANKVYINGAAAYENEIAGFPHKVITWRGPLSWHKAACPVDKTPLSEKRDRFKHRSEICYTISELGEFEWSLAFCPDVSGNAAAGASKRSLHCLLCGAQHNWCVFYRRASDQGFLGYSGCDCFREVLTNIKHPAVEEVAKAAKEEKARAEKFRKTMEKINDFKRDFPGLYEHREWLGSYKNPYERLWHEVENQLNRAEGVDEEFLAKCASGEFDRTSRRNWNDQAARRLPGFLKWAANEIIGDPKNLAHVQAKLLDKAVTDDNEHFNAKRHCERMERNYPGYTGGRITLPAPQYPVPAWRRQPPPAPTPVAQTPAATTNAQVVPPLPPAAPAQPAKPLTPAQQDAQALADKGLAWSNIVKDVLAGKKLSPGAQRWFDARLVEKGIKSLPKQDDTPKEPVEGKAPITEPSELTIQVGDGEG